MKSVKRRTDEIFIGKEAFLYLKRLGRQQRGAKPLSEEVENTAWDRAVKFNRGYPVHDGTFGGGIGSHDFHTWNSWSVRQVKRILETANLPYIEGEAHEVFDIYI